MSRLDFYSRIDSNLKLSHLQLIFSLEYIVQPYIKHFTFSSLLSIINFTESSHSKLIVTTKPNTRPSILSLFNAKTYSQSMSCRNPHL